ncbi:MAG: methyltransferase domain-containing protein [Candidatus Pacebacteria bacterium]|nr:methyltransferase domain-containing protein [Candidatus Paceibacterota bacterium]
MRFADPTANIEQFRLDPGMSVAELGAGIGAYSIAAARVVGRRGVVYAVDIQQDLLARIAHTADREGLENVEVVWGDIEAVGGSKLLDESIDAIIVSNVLFLTEDKDGVAREAVRILKKNGKVLVVDWKDSFGGLGPKRDSIITASETKELFARHGLTVEREIQAGAHHYGIIFRQKR